MDRTEERENGNFHYIRLHAVIKKESEMTKLRVVYDSSARSNGPSLNDCRYAGPSFNQSILQILLKFRVSSIALIGDIEKAFLTILVNPG